MPDREKELPGMSCTHQRTRDMASYAYMMPVAVQQEPAAHGSSCVDVECLDCGAHRLENRNGNHRELGAWSPPSPVT